MASRKKSVPTSRVRNGGAVGDPSMDEMEAYNASGAGVEVRVIDCNGDPNAHLPKRRMKGSEA